MPDKDGVVEDAVGQAGLHERAGGLDDVEIGQGITIGRNDDTRSDALPAVHADRDHRGMNLLDRGETLGLRIEYDLVHVERRGRKRRQRQPRSRQNGES